jgi:hypothetical protein
MHAKCTQPNRQAAKDRLQRIKTNKGNLDEDFNRHGHTGQDDG